MELSNTDDSKKDEAMKRTFESSTDDKETSANKKKAPKKAIFLPVEKIEETRPEKSKDIAGSDEDAPKKSVFKEILDAGDRKKEQQASEKSIETLDDDEKVVAAEAIVDDSLEDAGQELVQSEQGSIEEAEAAASVVFLEALKNNLDEGSEVDESKIQEVADEIIQNLEVEDVIEESEESGPELEDVEPTAQETAETEAEEPEEDDLATAGTTPPVPPVPPTPPVTPPPAPPAGGGYAPPGALPPMGPDIDPPAPVIIASPERPSDEEFSGRRSRAGDLLLGGVIGYMIGRRRGRINTEKKLMPIQEKLEKEVKTLQQTIASKELLVRKAAAANYEKRVLVVEKPEPKPEVEELREKYKKTQKPETDAIKQTENAEQTGAPSLIPEQEKLVRSREIESYSPEKRTPRQKSVETMSLPLLLEIAKDIKLDDISLRSMYEKGVVDQKHLRTILKRYLNGESLEELWPEALKTEINGQEQKQERSIEQKLDDNSGSDLQQVVSHQVDNPELNTAEPRHYSGPDTPISPVIQSILDEMAQEKEKKQSSISPVYLMILAVIAAIVIISIFT